MRGASAEMLRYGLEHLGDRPNRNVPPAGPAEHSSPSHARPFAFRHPRRRAGHCGWISSSLTRACQRSFSVRTNCPVDSGVPAPPAASPRLIRRARTSGSDRNTSISRLMRELLWPACPPGRPRRTTRRCGSPEASRRSSASPPDPEAFSALTAMPAQLAGFGERFDLGQRADHDLNDAGCGVLQHLRRPT